MRSPLRGLERKVSHSTIVPMLVLAGLGPAYAASSRPGEATSGSAAEPFEPMGVLSGRITDDEGRPADDAQIALMGARHHRPDATRRSAVVATTPRFERWSS